MHPLEIYLRAIREIRDSGAGVAETSYYPAISALLGRALRLEEVREVSGMARRIAAILLREPALDEAYAAVKGAAWSWSAAPGGSKPADTGGA